MMLKRFLLIAILIPGLLATARAQEAEEWETVVKQNDLIVEMKKTEGTNVHTFRCSGYMKASVAAIENCIRDLDAMKKIAFRFDTADILNEPSLGLVTTKDMLYIYGKLDAPWPVMDRDCVAAFKYLIDPKSGIVTCEMLPQHTDYRLDKTGKERIRVTVAYGKYTLIPKGKDLTYAMAEGVGDPGGMVPTSVVNLFARYGFVYSFKKFRELATSEKYNNPAARIITTTAMPCTPPAISISKALVPPQ